MSTLTNDDVAHVAKLAKLSLTEKEIEKFKKDLAPVVDYFNELSQVNTDSTATTSQVTGLHDVVAIDEVGATTLPVEAATAGTDKIHNNLFVVDALLNKDNE